MRSKMRKLNLVAMLLIYYVIANVNNKRKYLNYLTISISITYVINVLPVRVLPHSSYIMLYNIV